MFFQVTIMLDLTSPSPYTKKSIDNVLASTKNNLMNGLL